MLRARHFSVIACVLAFLAAGCGPTAAHKGPGLFKPNAFPKEAKLEALSAQPAPTPVFEKTADVESWTLVAPLPLAYGPAPRVPIDAFEASFAEEVAKHPKLRFTEPMACVARQLAKFFVVNEARPSEDLQRFLIARCGSPSFSVRTFVSSTANLDLAITDDQLAESAKKNMGETVTALASDPGSLDVGIGFAREKDRLVIFWAATSHEADLELLPMAADGGKVVIKGTVHAEAESVSAAINRGRFEAAECVADATVALPKFAFTCEGDPKDAMAWIDIAALPPERLLSNGVALVLVAPGGGILPDTWKKPVLVGAAPAPSASIADGFVDAVNLVRAEAGLPKVMNAVKQSEAATRVTPHYFAAGFHLVREPIADLVALGMMAGWKVDGIVHNSVLTSAWTYESKDPRRLVASMLDTPTGRFVLLDKDIDVVSVGTVTHPEQQFLGAVVTGFRLYEYLSPEARLAKVNATITKKREAKGLGPAKVIAGVALETDKAVARIENQHYEPRPALQSFLADVTLKAQKATQGFVFETRDLEDFEIPDDIAEGAEIPLAIGVAYHRPEGEAWGRWVILVVTFASERA